MFYPSVLCSFEFEKRLETIFILVVCEKQDCKNNATCLIENGKVMCKCKPGYSDPRCTSCKYNSNILLNIILEITLNYASFQ